MKKLILVLAILVVASPAFAALDVNIVKLTGNQVQVRYTGADPCNLPRGFALVFEVNSTADVCGISKYKSGESKAGTDPCSRGYGIYPAKITFGADLNTPTGWGDPLADQNDPLPTGGDQVLPSKKFVLEFGSLYAPPSEAVNAPGADGNLCVLSFEPNGATPSFTIKMTGEGQYRVTGGAKTTHGVVHEKGETADVNKTLIIVVATPPPPDCCSMVIGQKFYRTICDPCLSVDINVTTVIYNRWVYLNKPKCWCCNAQKCGNGNYSGASKNYVDAFDVSSVKLSWFKAHTNPAYLPCVDFNMSGYVDAADVAILKLHWFKNVGSSGCL